MVTAEHENRRVSRTEKDGTVITLASHYQEKQLNSPNDLAVRSDGSIYFSDPPYGVKSEQEELGFYGVYRIARDGKLTLLVDDFVRPNGIVFSPDETKLYINDSQRRHIRVFEVEPDGTLGNGRVFAKLESSGERGAPDGMEVDVEGNLYSTGPGESGSLHLQVSYWAKFQFPKQQLIWHGEIAIAKRFILQLTLVSIVFVSTLLEDNSIT